MNPVCALGKGKSPPRKPRLPVASGEKGKSGKVETGADFNHWLESRGLNSRDIASLFAASINTVATVMDSRDRRA